MSAANTVCPSEAHARLKTDSQFPKLAYVGVQVLGDVVLELRNCSCGSTLCREVKK